MSSTLIQGKSNNCIKLENIKHQSILKSPRGQMGKINSFERQLWESQIEEQGTYMVAFLWEIFTHEGIPGSRAPVSWWLRAIEASSLFVTQTSRVPPESTKSVCDLCLSSCLSGIPKSQSVAPRPHSASVWVGRWGLLRTEIWIL